MQQEKAPKAITLRGIPAATVRRIESRAARDGISLNRAVLRMLEETGRNSTDEAQRAPGNLLRKHAGTWTAEEADEFDAYLWEARKVEPTDWE